MKAVEQHPHEDKPAPGWACIGLGVGFIVVLVLSLVLVRALAG
jgi:hypothetical protein